MGVTNPSPPLTARPAPGMTGILLCAAGLPVCLTRAPKPILHPPPVSKSDVKPVPGVPGVCRKTKKKHLKKSMSSATLGPLNSDVRLGLAISPATSNHPLPPSPSAGLSPCSNLQHLTPEPIPSHAPGGGRPWVPHDCVLTRVPAGKNPEDVVRRYMQKVKNPPDEVSPGEGPDLGPQPSLPAQLLGFRCCRPLLPALFAPAFEF